MGSTTEKVIDLQSIRNSRIKVKNDVEYDEIYDDIVFKLKELVNNKAEEYKNIGTPHILELERKCDVMTNNLKHCIPYHIIIYLCFNAIIFGASITLLLLDMFLNFHIINNYYIICAIIGSVSLFFTALLSISDWKEYITNVEER